jgi:hypothetical protein
MKDTIFIKRYPAKGEFPKEEGYYHTFDLVTRHKSYQYWYDKRHIREYFDASIDYWLEEKEIPSDVEIKKPITRNDIVDYLDKQFWNHKTYECMPENEVGYEYIPRESLEKIVDGLIPMVKRLIKSKLGLK